MGRAQWLGLLGPSLGVHRRAQRPLGDGSEQYTLSTLLTGDCGSTGGLPTQTPVPTGHACCAVSSCSVMEGPHAKRGLSLRRAISPRICHWKQLPGGYSLAHMVAGIASLSWNNSRHGSPFEHSILGVERTPSCQEEMSPLGTAPELRSVVRHLKLFQGILP